MKKKLESVGKISSIVFAPNVATKKHSARLMNSCTLKFDPLSPGEEYKGLLEFYRRSVTTDSLRKSKCQFKLQNVDREKPQISIEFISGRKLELKDVSYLSCDLICQFVRYTKQKVRRDMDFMEEDFYDSEDEDAETIKADFEAQLEKAKAMRAVTGGGKKKGKK